MTDKNRPSRFARNAVANWIAFLYVAIVGFLLSPYVVDHLGATRYGVWALIAGLVGYLGLLDLGIRQAVNRYTARHHSAGDHLGCSLIISAALRLFGFLGLVAILLSVVLAWFAPHLFNIPGELADEARVIIVLGGLSIAVSLVSGVFGGVITGIERFDIQCCIEILLTTTRTVAIVLALHEGHGLLALAVIQLLATILNCIVVASAVRWLYPELRIRLWADLGPQMRTILSFSASLTVLYVLSKIISYSDAAVIAAFLPIESVTYFAIAGNLCLYAKEVPRALSSLMTPRISALTSSGSTGVGALILGVAKIATLAATAIAITFILRGESFITLWMGSAYGPLSGQVLLILAIVVWLDASRSVILDSLTGMAKQSTVIAGVGIEAACNLALSLALVKPLGIVGVALGTLIPSAFVSVVYFPRRLSRVTGVPTVLFGRDAILLPTIACFPFGLATAMLERASPATSLPVFFLQTFLILPLVPVTAWFLCLSTSEKEQVRLELRKATRR